MLVNFIAFEEAANNNINPSFNYKGSSMSRHENKTCPMCGIIFECQPGDITKCQCYTVALNDAERDYVAGKYNTCLCTDCIKQLRVDYNQRK